MSERSLFADQTPLSTCLLRRRTHYILAFFAIKIQRSDAVAPKAVAWFGNEWRYLRPSQVCGRSQHLANIPGAEGRLDAGLEPQLNAGTGVKLGHRTYAGTNDLVQKAGRRAVNGGGDRS